MQTHIPKKTILINTPNITLLGGVANHYLGLKPFFSDRVVYNQFYTQDYIRKSIKAASLFKLIIPFVFVYNYVKFIGLILKYNKPIILLNPSLGKTAIKRDSVYLKIAKLFNCKVAVFIHGWDQMYFNKLVIHQEKFSEAWLQADMFFVLASEFKKGLRQLGIKAPIYLTTTKVSDSLIKEIPLNKKTKVSTLLFLTRIETYKGIYTAIDAFEIIEKKYPHLQFRIVGNGSIFENVISYVESKNLQNVQFTGALFGKELIREYQSADIYIFPSHGEGMPNSVLEAMAFGLPVITRPVGGLVDFFENDKMGYMLESLDSKDYAEKIEYLINNIDKVNEIAQYNWDYAREHFLASKVAVELEKKIQTLNDN